MKKLFVRVSPSLDARIREKCSDARIPIYRLFEMAIDRALAVPFRFWQVAGGSIPKRRSGTRLDAHLVAIGTQVSEAHYERLTGLAETSKRFISDILTAALLYYVQQEQRSPATKRAAMQSFVYPSFPARALTLPKSVGAEARCLDSIPSGSWVLLDAWVLFCGISTVSRSSVCSYLSDQCWRLLQRSRLGELTCMVSALELFRFQRLLAAFGSRAKKQGARRNRKLEFSKEIEISRRIYAVFRSGLQVIPLMPEHVHAGVAKLDENDSRSAITIASAKAYCRTRFVIAALDSCYDRWSGDFTVHKARDTRSSSVFEPEALKSIENTTVAPRVQETTAEKYARIMAANGLDLPTP